MLDEPGVILLVCTFLTIWHLRLLVSTSVKAPSTHAHSFNVPHDYSNLMMDVSDSIISTSSSAGTVHRTLLVQSPKIFKVGKEG